MSNLRTLVDNIKQADISKNPEAFLRFKIMREWPLGQETFKLFSVKIKHLTPDFIQQARSLVTEQPKRILSFTFTKSGDSSFGSHSSISSADIEDKIYQAVLVEAHKQGLRINLNLTDLAPKGISDQNLRQTTLEQQEIGAFYLR
jgi:hypothetical protein